MNTFIGLRGVVGPRGGVEQTSAAMSKFPREDTRPAGHVPYDIPELPGQAPHDACSPEIAEKNAEEAIRKLMSEQKRVVSRSQLPKLEIDPETVAAEPVRHPRRAPAAPAAPAERQTGRAPGAIVERPATRQRAWAPGASVRALKTRIAGLAPKRLAGQLQGRRPTPKLMFWAVVALIFLVKPWLIPAILFVVFWIALIAYLTLGPDRVAEIVTGGWHRLQRRRPDLASRIRTRADETAMRVDAMLDRVPGKWKEGLYMPDFSQAAADAAALEERPDPFERIAAETGRG